ncbi:ABC transporter family protein [Babesia bovis T2Bo]|uniref:ABC transporter family protein n=1 Tax=Babesia bovis T2Bo TaxID=484906 RepID=UPI001C35D224|nr:ABC transporter family protein [Babesia bovis T2Bo]EDO08144.2 ABC transporter family protein [Babesia bovis T2Bo]
MKPYNMFTATDIFTMDPNDIYDSRMVDKTQHKSYNDSGICNFLLLRWAKWWVKYICTHIIEPEGVHRLPEADQISYWQPILSKHVSDGILRLEESQRQQSDDLQDGKGKKRGRSIMLRAILLTFWRRIALTLLVMIIIAITTAVTVMFLKRLLTMLSSKEQDWGMIVLLVCSIVGIETVNTFLDQHANLYNMRLQTLMEASIAITLFQHGLCHRRDYPNLMRAHSVRQGCKSAVHVASSTNQDACEILACPARRHQNAELTPSMYTFLFVDTYYIVALVDACVMLLRFICNIIAGILLIYTQTGMDILLPIIIIASSIVIMILVEVINACNIIHSLRSKDDRISKSSDIIGSLKMLEVAGIEDIGFNVIQDSRSDELAVLQSRLSLFSINRSLMRVIGAIVYIVVILGFIRKEKSGANGADFDVSLPITLLHIVNAIVGSFDYLLKSLKIVVEGVTSIGRIETYMKTCSPNFYLTNRNILTGSPRKSLPAEIPKGDKNISKNTLVILKDASFTWLNVREEFLMQSPQPPLVFSGVNFELKRGDIRIVTGNQGSGKTSFIKSILGEMTLVSGSMAVAPLSTDMPIFYSSQDIWLPSGTIRSVITFGYTFDEEVYHQVLRSVELESDIQSWANGDSRVISEQGYSLSGGQRVRVGLARALYAYMIFSKANEQLENRCCFLVCLDEPFHGLDPNVTIKIFDNLFNKRTGLLVRDDVAVILTMSKSVINLYTSSDVQSNLVNIQIHHINGLEVGSPELMDVGSPHRLKSSEELSTPGAGESHIVGSYDCFAHSQRFNVLYHEVESTVDAFNTDPQGEGNRAKLSLEDQKKQCATSSAYGLYISGMGIFYSLAIFISLITAIVLDKVFGILVAQWSDVVKSLEGNDTVQTNQDEILAKHTEVATKLKILVPSFIALVFIGMFIAVFANIRASTRIHEFIMNSIFQRSSSELKLKNSLAKIITFLTSDIYYIDEHVGRFIVATLFSFLSICVQFITICYTVPILSPIPILMGVILYLFVVKNYLIASKILQNVMLEANNSINAVYGDVIAGSAIYRSFRKEHLCIKRVCVYSENFYAIKFLKIALTTWAMLTCKLFAVGIVLCAAFIPVVYAYFRGDELKVAQIGLGISYSLGINGLLHGFIFNFSMLEKQMCSMVRFRDYFLQGKTSLRHTFETMNETVMITNAFTEYLGDNQRRWSGLSRRRKNEYYNFLFRKYLSCLGYLFYRPKVEFLDCEYYLPGEHTTLELRDVSVTIPPRTETNVPSPILKHVTASANAGDIIGIVGRTGAGKSTLLATLQNIVEHRDGSLLIDGREMKSIPRKVLRHIVGVLPQMPFIPKGWTLRRFLDPRMLYSDDEIISALECCGLQDLVNIEGGTNLLDAILVRSNIKVNKGLYLMPPLVRLRGPKDDAICLDRSLSGSRGNNENRNSGFSTSQLRQLSFARLVLYRKTYRILLIDEPPAENCESAPKEILDTPRESTNDIGMPIYDLVKIHFRHCTTFIVAHNKNALKTCTAVWIMRDGMLVRECSAEEFMVNGRKIMANIELYLANMDST